MRTSAHWLEEVSPDVSLDLYRDLALSHACEGGAQGNRIATLIRRDDIRGLCEFEMDYLEEGVTAAEIFSCRQALAFFQKIKPLDIGRDREREALEKFISAEALCKSTNDLLRDRRLGLCDYTGRVNTVFHRAQRKIAKILGPVPRLGELDFHFGPGATRATRRKVASTRRKLAERLQCSKDLAGMVPHILEEMPHLVDVHSVLDRTDEDGEEWALVQVELVPAKLSFVPKNAKSLRSICTEPGLNTMVQLALGARMSERLAAFGIDIRDQTVNQRRALEGSRTGALATLDLSSASDTIARELVFELLPLDWASLLAKARSSHVLLPGGSEIRQEKFSSMGNGFTFPLETLIFWSLAASCCNSDEDATAYGDDLIVPSDRYPLLVEVLVAAGFVVNQAKSYHTGPFRESCGKDYFSGTDVRPIYAKGWVTAQSLFVLHNWYVRRGDLERARVVLGKIHPSLHIWGPDGYGDGHLLGDHPRRRPSKYHDRGFSGYFFDTFVAKSERDQLPLNRGEYVVSLYSIYRRSGGDEFLPSTCCLRRVDPSKVDVGKGSFLRLWSRGTGPAGTAPLPLADAEGDVKALPLPGVSGYKKISVYTLRD